MIPRGKERLIRALRWSETYTRTDMLYLASGGFWLGLGQFTASLTSFILGVAFANLVPRETYGMYKYVLSAMGILGIATLPGINTYMAQAIARGAEGTFLLGSYARMRWGLLSGLAGLLAAGYYFLNGNMTLAASFALASVFLPFMDALGNFNVYLQAKKMFKESIGYYSIVQILSTVAILATLYVAPTAAMLVLAYFGSYTLFRLYIFIRTLRMYPPKEETDKAMVRYGMHLSVVNVLGQVATQIDSAVLFHTLGAAAVAVYSFALAPSEQVRSLFKNIVPLALPRLSHRTFHEINATLPKRLLQMTLLGAASAAVYFIISPYFFGFFFPKYLDAVGLSQLIAWLLILTMPSMYFAAAIQSKLSHMPASWLYWSTVPDAFHVLGLFVFIPLFGIYGIVLIKAIDLALTLGIGLVQWALLVRRHSTT